MEYMERETLEEEIRSGEVSEDDSAMIAAGLQTFTTGNMVLDQIPDQGSDGELPSDLVKAPDSQPRRKDGRWKKLDAEIIEASRQAGETQSFSVGTIVWAKPFQSHPFWPAQIADFKRSYAQLDKKRKAEEQLVYFFGTHDFMNLHPRNLLPFRTVMFDTLSRSISSRKHGTAAIAEATDVEADSLSKYSSLENEIFCAVCHRGGDMVVCEGPCRRSFHAACLKLMPHMPPVTNEDYFCLDCRHVKEMDGVPTAAASGNGSSAKRNSLSSIASFAVASHAQTASGRAAADDTNSDALFIPQQEDIDRFSRGPSPSSVVYESEEEPVRVVSKKGSPLMVHCKDVLKKVLKHPHAWPFRKPIDYKAMGLKDYLSVVKEPLDLGIVKERLLSRKYASVSELVADVKHVFDNVRAYFHDPAVETRKLGDRLEAYFKKEVRAKGKALWDSSTTPHWWPYILTGAPETPVITGKRERDTSVHSTTPKKMKAESSAQAGPAPEERQEEEEEDESAGGKSPVQLPPRRSRLRPETLSSLSARAVAGSTPRKPSRRPSPDRSYIYRDRSGATTSAAATAAAPEGAGSPDPLASRVLATFVPTGRKKYLLLYSRRFDDLLAAAKDRLQTGKDVRISTSKGVLIEDDYDVRALRSDDELEVRAINWSVSDAAAIAATITASEEAAMEGVEQQ